MNVAVKNGIDISKNCQSKSGKGASYKLQVTIRPLERGAFFVKSVKFTFSRKFCIIERKPKSPIFERFLGRLVFSLKNNS